MQRFLIAAASLALTLAAVVPNAARAQDPAATPAPAASTAPYTVPVGVKPETFVVGDFLVAPRVYNAASSGHSGLSSYATKFETEFKVDDLPFMVAFEQRDFAYTHFASGTHTCPGLGCVTQIGLTGQQYVHQEVERDTDMDGRVGFRIAYPRIYAVVAYLGRQNAFNYPVVNGLGFGFEKLPDYERKLSFYASAMYFPDLQGKYNVLNRTTGITTIYTLTQHVLRYQAGIAVSPFKGVPAFLDLGFLGDGVNAGAADPSSETHFTGYAGIGLYSK